MDLTKIVKVWGDSGWTTKAYAVRFQSPACDGDA